jgi:hypothetical protein
MEEAWRQVINCDSPPRKESTLNKRIDEVVME